MSLFYSCTVIGILDISLLSLHNPFPLLTSDFMLILISIGSQPMRWCLSSFVFQILKRRQRDYAWSSFLVSYGKRVGDKGSLESEILDSFSGFFSHSCSFLVYDIYLIRGHYVFKASINQLLWYQSTKRSIRLKLLLV